MKCGRYTLEQALQLIVGYIIMVLCTLLVLLVNFLLLIKIVMEELSLSILEVVEVFFTVLPNYLTWTNCAHVYGHVGYVVKEAILLCLDLINKNY